MSDTESRVTYVPGRGLAVVGAEVLVLLPADAEPRLARDVHAALVPGAGVADVLQILTGEFAASLARIPAFALAVISPSGVQAVARGDFEVRVGGGEATETVSGVGVSTWTERFVAGAADAVLLGPGGGDGESWPLDGGVVRADAVSFRSAGAPADVPSAARGTAARVGAPTPAPTPGGAPEIAPEPPPEIAPEPPPGSEPEPAPKPDPETGTAPDGVAPEETVVPAETVLPPVAAGDESFDHLWGSTVLRPVEQAAVRADEQDDDVDPAPVPTPARQPAAARPQAPAAGSIAAPSPVEIAPTPGPSAPPLTSQPASGSQATREPRSTPDPEPAPSPVVDPAPAPAWTPPFTIDATATATADPTAASAPASAAPASEAAAADAPGEAGVPEFGDHDGETVVRGPFAVVAPEPAPAEPSDRPGVGRIRLSTGQELTLDRPVVVGRKPRVSRVGGASVPRLVSVPSPEQDISRSHLEVRLEGVSVLVVDLGSTNGSTLLRTGQLPVRLHPHEAVLVVDGDVVDLGEGVTLTFEDLA